MSIEEKPDLQRNSLDPLHPPTVTQKVSNFSFFLLIKKICLIIQYMYVELYAGSEATYSFKYISYSF